MTIKSLTGPPRPGVSLDDGFTEKFKVFCRPPQTRNNNNNLAIWLEQLHSFSNHATAARAPFSIRVVSLTLGFPCTTRPPFAWRIEKRLSSVLFSSQQRPHDLYSCTLHVAVITPTTSMNTAVSLCGSYYLHSCIHR